MPLSRLIFQKITAQQCASHSDLELFSHGQVRWISLLQCCLYGRQQKIRKTDVVRSWVVWDIYAILYNDQSLIRDMMGRQSAAQLWCIFVSQHRHITWARNRSGQVGNLLATTVHSPETIKDPMQILLSLMRAFEENYAIRSVALYVTA